MSIDTERRGFGRCAATGICDLRRNCNGTDGIQEAGGIAGRGRTAYVGRSRDGVAANRRAIRARRTVDGQLGLALSVDIDAPAADDGIVVDRRGGDAGNSRYHGRRHGNREPIAV